MSSILDYPIQITLSDLIIIIVLFLIVAQAPFIFYWFNNRKWNPEGAIFIRARKEGIPVIRKVAMNGFFKFLLGEKEKRGDPIFKFDRDANEGIRFDNRLQSGGISREFTTGGLEMIHMGTNSPFSLSSKNVLAMDTVIKHVRKNYLQLTFLPDQLVLEYIQRNRADLPFDCKNIVETYDFEGKIEVPQAVLDEFKLLVTEQIKDKLLEDGENREPSQEEIEELYQQNVTAYKKQYQSSNLVELFKKIQDEVINLPVEVNRYFSFVEAFQNISSAFSAADIQNYLHLIERIADLKKSLSEKERVLLYAIAAIIVLIGGAVALNYKG